MSCVFRKHFEETDFSGIFLIPMYTSILGLLVKKFLIFGSSFANFSKPLSKSWDKQFDEFFWENLFFRFLVETTSDVRKKLYRKVVKTNFYLFRKPVDETDFFDFSNVFDTYSNFGGNFFWLLAQIIPVNLSKLLSTSSDELSDQKNFWENFQSFFVGLWSKLFLTLAKKCT